MVIDCFSKFVFAVPLTRKTTVAIINGFETIFESTERRPERLQTDKGGEYDSNKFRQFMKKNDIIFNTTNNPDIKCSIAERVIRTIKTKLFKYLTYKNSFKFIDVFDDIIKSYNCGYHRTIKMAPNEVNDGNILKVYRNIRESQMTQQRKYRNIKVSQEILKKKRKKTWRPKLKIGDYVRITKEKYVFSKGYTPNWTEEVFKVKSVVQRTPIVYTLVDLKGEEIEGTFYATEVQKVNFDEGALRVIDKIIKQSGTGKNIQYFVKWRGYPTKFNSWVDAKIVNST